MESLDGRHFAEVDAQKGCPVKCWHNHFAIFSATQLGNVDSRGLSDHSRNVIQAVNLGLPVQTLDETKTPVTVEFGVASQQERQCDLLVPPSHDSLTFVYAPFLNMTTGSAIYPYLKKYII